MSKPKTSHDIGDIKNKEKKLYHLGINNTSMYFRLVPLKGENMNSNNIQVNYINDIIIIIRIII